MTGKEQLYAVIMAGGVGARFWPSSRAKTPKQLLDLTGSGRSMIAATVDRLLPDIPPERILVVTGEATRKAVREALPEIPEKNILAEPVARNTAPCVGWAALRVKRQDPRGILAIMPSDHLVADRPAFQRAMGVAVEAAGQGAIVTFGIIPDRPETGFGYIEIGEERSPGLREVTRFVEKPDIENARKYVERGNFVWNSGMFFFSAERILGEIARQMPELNKELKAIETAIEKGGEEEAVRTIYPALPSQSIDYGIMEGATGIRCVPVDFGWSDLGSWAAAYDLSKKDADANAQGLEAIAVDSRGCLVRAPAGKLVALVGVEDLVVVDTGDALLVCRRGAAQDVKEVVSRLKKQGRFDIL